MYFSQLPFKRKGKKGHVTGISISMNTLKETTFFVWFRWCSYLYTVWRSQHTLLKYTWLLAAQDTIKHQGAWQIADLILRVQGWRAYVNVSAWLMEQSPKRSVEPLWLFSNVHCSSSNIFNTVKHVGGSIMIRGCNLSSRDFTTKERKNGV